MQAFEDLQKLAQVDVELTSLRIKKMFVARGRGDFKGFASFFLPAMTFNIIVPRGMAPGWGSQKGLEAFINFVRFNYTNYEWLEHEISDILIMGGDAVVRRKSLSRNRGTGLVQQLNVCTLLKFQDGLIQEYIEYVDTAALVRLLLGDKPS